MIDGAGLLGSLPEKNIDSPNRRGRVGRASTYKPLGDRRGPLLKICSFSNFLLFFKTSLSPVVVVEGVNLIFYQILNPQSSQILYPKQRTDVQLNRRPNGTESPHRPITDEDESRARYPRLQRGRYIPLVIRRDTDWWNCVLAEKGKRKQQNVVFRGARTELNNERNGRVRFDAESRQSSPVHDRFQAQLQGVRGRCVFGDCEVEW